MTTPMNLTYPTPGVGGTSGPLWAQSLNDNFELIEDHDHTSGKGAPIVAASLDIDDDLPFNAHQATELDAAQFVDSSLDPSTPATANNLSLFAKNGNLYFQDGLGSAAAVQITAAGAVAGTPGSIGSLTAPASVTWVALAGNLIFEADSGDGTMMNLVSGGLVLTPPGAGGSSADTVTINAPAVPTAPGYTITLPVAPGSTTQALGMDSSGNLVFDAIPGILPLGSVIATFPNLTGAYTCSATTTADSRGLVKCNGQTVSDAASPMNGQVIPNINNDVFLAGHTTSGTAGGANTHTHSLSVSGSVTMPAHTHDLDGNGAACLSIAYAGGQEFHYTSAGVVFTPSVNRSFTNTSGSSPGSTFGISLAGRTSGITSAPSVGFTSTGTSGASDSRPSYITAVYCMRIK